MLYKFVQCLLETFHVFLQSLFCRIPSILALKPYSKAYYTASHEILSSEATPDIRFCICLSRLNLSQ